MRIAFYAPLKPPDHPVPSGDRRMARLLMAALARAGHEVALASTLRAYAMEETAAVQGEIEEAGAAEAEALLDHWRERPADRPDLWFTYHLYYRAPDWIGPRIAGDLAIPYAVAEASFAMKRATGVWAPGHEAVARALSRAALVFSLARRDRPGLASVPGFAARVVDLPPFIDIPPPATPARRDDAVPVLLAVAMMRARAKVASYRIIGEALSRLVDLPWRLVVAGDGPARGEVEAALAALGPGRVSWLGAVDAEAIGEVYAGADLLVWPGFDEAYGMVYLEAQAAGVPVAAMDWGGVGEVVRDGVSGRLTAAGDLDAYVAGLRELIGARGLRARLSASARDFVASEHSLDTASKIMNEALSSLARAA